MNVMQTAILSVWHCLTSCVGAIVLVCFLVSLALFLAERIVYRRKKGRQDNKA